MRVTKIIEKCPIINEDGEWQLFCQVYMGNSYIYGAIICKTKEEAFKILLSGTREHCRILLPWEETLEKASDIVKSQAPNMEIHENYKQLITLRKSDETLIYGDFTLLCDKKDRFVYKRSLNGKEYIVDCNLGKKVRKAYRVENGFRLVYASENNISKQYLNSYEVRIWGN